ncbi:MAG TPA: CHAT domain-containing protein [Pyrinomonadaceae bacterium]|nr:CHAT domain-containing protein [Pyrinomonadaceae bacterium]
MKVFCRSNLIAGPLVFVLLAAQPAAVLSQQLNDADAKKKAQAEEIFKEAAALADEEAPDKKREAIKRFLEAAEIFRSIGLRREQALTLNIAGEECEEVDERRRAIELFEQSAAINAAIGHKHNQAVAIHNIGVVLSRLKNNAGAIPYFQRALALQRETGHKPSEALSLSFLASSHDGLGDRRKAIEYSMQSLDLRRKLGDREGELSELSDLGVYYGGTGEYEKALIFLNDALKLSRELGDTGFEAIALHNIAGVQTDLGNLKAALEIYLKVIEMRQKPLDKFGLATTLSNVGTILMDLDNHQEALKYHELALQFRRETGDREGETVSLINIGHWYSEKGQHEKSRELLIKALETSRILGNRNLEASALHNIGWSYEPANRLKAIDFYYEALPLRRFVGDRTSEADTLNNLMYAWEALGNKKLAAFYGKQSINQYQRVRSGISGMDVESRKRYLKTVEETYRDVANLLITLGRIAEAEEVLGMLKEEEVFAFQRRDDKVARELMQTATMNESEKAAITGYEKIADEITAIAREYGELDRERFEYPEGKFPKQARLDELEKQRSDALVAFQKYLELLKVQFAKTSKEKEVALIDSSLQETLREMKADRTAVVSTIAGEKRLNIIVTTSTVQRAHTVEVTEEVLNKLVADFRAALTSPGTGKPIDPRPAGQKIYDLLVKPIEGDLAGLKADTIVWSLDGTLRYLPMAAVWDKQKGYLAQRFANAVITLASRDRLLQAPITKDRVALGAGVSAATDGFAPLSAVPDELDCIVTDPVAKTVSANPVCTSGVIPGQKLLDEKFNERAFRAALGRYSVLHLASHFKLVPGNDNDSFLLLGGGEDRRFTLLDLQSVSLNGVELLALSACNTATPGGEKANGVEIEGFGAIAQNKGARSVMATLWPVADPSTRDFMVEFYRRFGARTETKAESLRQAQLQLMRGSYQGSEGVKPPRADDFVPEKQAVGPVFETDKNAPYAHPYYWAPFILFGNWR